MTSEKEAKPFSEKNIVSQKLKICWADLKKKTGCLILKTRPLYSVELIMLKLKVKVSGLHKRDVAFCGDCQPK